MDNLSLLYKKKKPAKAGFFFLWKFYSFLKITFIKW